jgi:hypothetical protein
MRNAYYILIAIIIIPWIIILISAITKKKRIAGFCKQLVQKYSFSTGEPDDKKTKHFPPVSGIYRNRNISIHAKRKETGKKQIYTLTSVNILNKDNFEFLITKNNKQNRIKFPSAAKTGDAEFDDGFILVSNNHELAQKVLNFNTKFKLQQAADLDFKGEVRLRGNLLEYEEPGFINTPAALMRTELLLHELCDIADELKYA